MSPLVAQIIGENGKPEPFGPSHPDVDELFRNQDLHRSMGGNIHRTLATNIYQTKDGRYYHVHGMPLPSHI